MAEVEIPADAPAWMLALEKKRQRTHRLAHEVGAGSPCLLCKDDCPGLDLHFWRKLCRNCKCRKEDHDVVDDCGMEQFEILLGSGHSTNRPKKAFLELLERHTSAGLKKNGQSVAFDWIPPDVSPVIAAEYMQSLPANKLPISGSDGALYRRQQLERQLPLHDLDENHCHQLTESEVDNLKKYLDNLKTNVVGQGRVSKLYIPASNSLDSLQKMCTFNSIPKPFQTLGGKDPSLDSSSQISSGSKVDPQQAPYLKPPSAFWPKSVSPARSPARSPDIFRSVSPKPPSSTSSDSEYVSAQPELSGTLKPDPKLLPPKQLHRKEGSYEKNDMSNQYGNVNNSLCLDSHLVTDHTKKSMAQSVNVPGNMWVPSECPECARKSVEGQLVSDRVCTHIVKSDDVHHRVLQGEILPTVCTECSNKGLAGQLVREGICCHVQKDSDYLPRQSPLTEMALNRHGNLISHASGLPHELSDNDKVSRYLPGIKSNTESLLPAQNSNLKDMQLLKSKGIIDGIVSKEEQIAPSNLNIPSHQLLQDSSLQRNKSPTSMTSTVGTPHTMALYAYNAKDDPLHFDPQDIISPHIASMSIDDEAKSTVSFDVQNELNNDSDSIVHLDLHCVECKEDIVPGEVVVFADRAGPEVVWHPKCFVCNTCQELLVDLVYFYNKGHVYCGRHYAELLDIPRCSACDELIFVNEHTVAEGQAFHVKHFCCFECDDPLGGKQYVAKDGQPVCLPCYEKKYGKQCSTCSLVIGAKDQGVSWKDQHWHATANCFCCYCCQKSLLGGRFAVKDKHPFCSKECMQASI